MRQMEASKKEYIDKLKRELDLVEDKWFIINNENCMVGEDFRSLVLEMQARVQTLNQTVATREATIQELIDKVSSKTFKLESRAIEAENYQMFIEDLSASNLI